MHITGKIDVMPGSHDYLAVALASESNHVVPEGTEKPDFEMTINPDEITALRLMVVKLHDPQNVKVYGSAIPWHQLTVKVIHEMAEHGLVQGMDDWHSDRYHLTMFGRFVHALLDGDTYVYIRLPRVEGEWE